MAEDILKRAAQCAALPSNKFMAPYSAGEVLTSHLVAVLW